MTRLKLIRSATAIVHFVKFQLCSDDIMVEISNDS
jgi:hypothetical protein